jgi:hypothetical protein
VWRRECLLERQRLARQTVGQRLALEILHDEKANAFGIPNVVQRADVRMIERRDAFGLALEALARIGVLGDLRRENLIATVRSSRVSRARYTSPMPPAPSAETIS